MANNLVESLAQLKVKDPKRANWILDCPAVGTNDFGFYKVKQCKEVIAGSRVRYDFKSAYSTNPTICPVLSRAKAEVVAIWIPTRLYVPALRDGVQVKAGKDDYSFPTINFDYRGLRAVYDLSAQGSYVRDYGDNLPYIPANSIYSELGMWAPYFQPIGFAHRVEGLPYPEPKNAIPLLGYLDFYRHYVINSQNADRIPVRVKGYSRKWHIPSSPRADKEVFWVEQMPVDVYRTRDDFDNLFKRVRQIGVDYQLGDGNYDISSAISGFFNGNIAPLKTVVVDPNDDTVVVAFNDNHFGELRSTYFSDFYSAFLSNENVEYERSTARVQVDDEGFITMEQIYSAERVQNFYRRTIFRNSDYAEYCDVQYGVKPSTDITKPMFLGAVSTWLTFNDVVAQAQTSSTPSDISSNSDLGSRASLGFGRMITGKLINDKKRSFVDFTAREPGYFMVLECITPEVCYWQGFDPLYDKRSLGSLYYPAFDKDGYQDKQMKYLVEQVNDDLAKLPPAQLFGAYNIAYAQEPAWWEYMATYGRLSGQMVERGVYRHWVFSRDFEPSIIGNPNANPDNPPGYRTIQLNDLRNLAVNTYVDPEPFNEVFANINGLDNIQTYYRHELKIFQPLSHRFLSFS